jgi:hypothetical protein
MPDPVLLSTLKPTPDSHVSCLVHGNTAALPRRASPGPRYRCQGLATVVVAQRLFEFISNYSVVWPDYEKVKARFNAYVQSLVGSHKTLFFLAENAF